MSMLNIHNVRKITIKPRDEDDSWTCIVVHYSDHFDNLHTAEITLFDHDGVEPKIYTPNYQLIQKGENE